MLLSVSQLKLFGDDASEAYMAIAFPGRDDNKTQERDKFPIG